MVRRTPRPRQKKIWPGLLKPSQSSTASLLGIPQELRDMIFGLCVKRRTFWGAATAAYTTSITSGTRIYAVYYLSHFYFLSILVLSHELFQQFTAFLLRTTKLHIQIQPFPQIPPGLGTPFITGRSSTAPSFAPNWSLISKLRAVSLVINLNIFPHTIGAYDPNAPAFPFPALSDWIQNFSAVSMPLAHELYIELLVDRLPNPQNDSALQNIFSYETMTPCFSSVFGLDILRRMHARDKRGSGAIPGLWEKRFPMWVTPAVIRGAREDPRMSHYFVHDRKFEWNNVFYSTYSESLERWV